MSNLTLARLVRPVASWKMGRYLIEYGLSPAFGESARLFLSTHLLGDILKGKFSSLGCFFFLEVEIDGRWDTLSQLI